MYQVAYVSEQYGWEAVFNVLVVSLLVSAVMVARMAVRDFGYLKGVGNPRLESLQAPPPPSQLRNDAAYAPPVLDNTAGGDDVAAGTQ